MKKILLIISLIFTFTFTACSEKEAPKTDKTVVVATTYAIYDAIKHIGGAQITTSMLIPPGREIHSFEPSPKDIVKLNEASVVFYNGEGLEPWIGQFDIGAKAIDLSRYVTLLEVEEAPHEHEAEETHRHHHHGTHDPHYWLDFDNMKKVATVITKRLCELKPKNEPLFHKRLQSYLQMLTQLDNHYAKTLKTCKLHTIYVNHNAYSYLAKRYGFTVKSLVGLSPEAQPSPKTVESILEGVKKEGAKAIYHEPFENNAVLFSIAKESGLKPLVLQPLGNVTAQEAKANLGYKEIMERNLQNLSYGLECNAL